MKIAVDVIDVNQKWVADTNEQVNTLTLRIGREQLVVPVSEAIIQELVRMRSGQVASSAAPAELPPEARLDEQIEDELNGEGDDTVFGGDVNEDEPVASPPSTFVEDPEDVPIDEPPPSGAEDAVETTAEPVEPKALPPAPPQPEKVVLPLVMKGKILKPNEIQALTADQRKRLEAEMKRRYDAKDSSYLRILRQHQMRQRAARVPQRTVSADETGAPITKASVSATPAPSGQRTAVAPPELVTQQPQARDVPVGGTDDDGFAQG